VLAGFNKNNNNNNLIYKVPYGRIFKGAVKAKADGAKFN